jgi:hypothetical protein
VEANRANRSYRAEVLVLLDEESAWDKHKRESGKGKRDELSIKTTRNGMIPREGRTEDKKNREGVTTTHHDAA